MGDVGGHLHVSMFGTGPQRLGFSVNSLHIFRFDRVRRYDATNAKITAF